MRIAHWALKSYQCTFEVWDGDVDECEVRSHLRRLAEDPDWPPGVLNLVDLTTVGKVSVPDPDLVAVLREGTILERQLKTALVVRREWIAENRPQYDGTVEATGVSAFSNLRAASVHLGIPLEISVQAMARLRKQLPRKQD